MKEISYNEFLGRLQNYYGRKVEVCFEPKDFPRSIGTYQKFYFENTYDNSDNKILFFYDTYDGIDSNNKIYIDKEKIRKIKYFEDDSVYNTVFSIILDNCEISLCLNETPIICCLCGKVIEDPMETIWHIQGVGGYGSHWDNEQLKVNFCDDCLFSLLYGEDGEINE